MFKRGEPVLLEGAESYDVYVILSGEAELVKSYLGEPIGIRTFKKGDVFGASGLITKSPRFATIIAKTDLELGMMYREDFLSILEKLPPDVYTMLNSMVAQLRASYEVSAELAVNTKKMQNIKEKMKSLNKDKRKEYFTQSPEIVQSTIISIRRGLTEMIHNFSKMANQLDKTVSEIDTLFAQIREPRS
ncbi:MAG: cyclic nucleotide-binding domain-containing protein [Planctomycetes bacterium]|nr:cyclic nucleotide-binding domain-containing protein [Planctomycetota bacterium]